MGPGLGESMTRYREAPTALYLTLLALVASLAGASPADAQVIRGWVIQAGRTPIPDATVLLRAEDGTVRARTTSTEGGRFELQPTSGGRMRLEAAHLGFADWETTAFELAGDADLEVLIRLQLAPIELDEVRVEASRRLTTRRLEDFERRRDIQAFGGFFLVEEDIARRPASRPSNLVLEAPGMTVRGGGGPFDLYTIFSGDCPATVFVDGVRINQQVTSVDEYLELDRIAGVEVYPRGMSAPPQYQDALRRECGTVVYWTKELEPDREGGWSATKIALGVTGVVGLLMIGLAR